MLLTDVAVPLAGLIADRYIVQRNVQVGAEHADIVMERNVQLLVDSSLVQYGA